VRNVADWPHSSFHRYVKQGLLPLNWASDVHSDATWGEPDFDD
jgi:putative transposase